EQQLAQTVELRLQARPLARRKAGDQQAAGQVLAVADADLLVVEHGAGAAAGGEQLVAQRIEDDAMGRLALLDQRDRDAEVREATQVVGGAVERIDDEGRLRTGLAAAFHVPGLLGEDAVVGESAAQLAYDFG